MSDEEVEVPNEDLSESEQVEGTDSAEEIILSALDIEQYGSHVVTVKVNGEELQVPISEAIAGYQRQKDYTSKTQELAAQREELQFAAAIKGALANDPEGTIEALRSHYGLGQSAAAGTEFEEIFQEGSSNDPKLTDLERRIARFEEAQATAALHSTLTTLQTKYGEIFDPKEVVAAALQLNSTDLEGTFKQIAFDRILAKQEADKTASAQKAATTAAKREGGLVAGGNVPRGAVDSVGEIRSIDDAFRAAKAEHGF